MKKTILAVLMTVLILGTNGIIFGQEGSESNELSRSRDGVLISDFAGNPCHEEEDENKSLGGVLIGDFYEWVTGDSDDEKCEQE